jgi:hypothetical protein
MKDIEFPEWLSIIDTSDDIKPLQGGDSKLTDSDNLNTEDLQMEIKKLFKEIETQSGGKKKRSSKRSSKKRSSKRSSKKRSSKRKSSKSSGPLDNYNIALNHIAEVMKLGKSVKDRAPAREVIKKIQKIIDQSLSGEAKYKEINKVFDSDPKKYM